jgi:WD40 repeat protein
LIDSKSGELRQEIAKGNDLVYSAAWSHDGKYLAVGTTVGEIQLFDVSKRPARPVRRISAGHRIVFSLTFTWDGGALIGGLGDESNNGGDAVAIWNLPDGQLAREFHEHEFYVYSVAISRNRIIASAGPDGVIRLWDFATGALLAVVHDPQESVNHVAFSDDGRYLAAASGPGKLRGVPGPDNTVRLYWLGLGRAPARTPSRH